VKSVGGTKKKIRKKGSSGGSAGTLSTGVAVRRMEGFKSCGGGAGPFGKGSVVRVVCACGGHPK